MMELRQDMETCKANNIPIALCNVVHTAQCHHGDFE